MDQALAILILGLAATLANGNPVPYRRGLVESIETILNGGAITVDPHSLIEVAPNKKTKPRVSKPKLRALTKPRQQIIKEYADDEYLDDEYEYTGRSPQRSIIIPSMEAIVSRRSMIPSRRFISRRGLIPVLRFQSLQKTIAPFASAAASAMASGASALSSGLRASLLGTDFIGDFARSNFGGNPELQFNSVQSQEAEGGLAAAAAGALRAGLRGGTGWRVKIDSKGLAAASTGKRKKSKPKKKGRAKARNVSDVFSTK